MDQLHETLIDLALEIGYQMGEKGESFGIDSREAVTLIFDAALKFEDRHSRTSADYLTKVQEAATAFYWELRLENSI